MESAILIWATTTVGILVLVYCFWIWNDSDFCWRVYKKWESNVDGPECRTFSEYLTWLRVDRNGLRYERVLWRHARAMERR